MELNELYDIIGTAIMLITEIIIFYSIIKLVKLFVCEIYNSKSKINRMLEEEYKKTHFNKHFKKWLKDKELQKKYNDFYEYYEIQYNKRNMYSQAYKDFIKYKENKE